MADVNALFKEVSSLSKDDAKALKELLVAKLPKSAPKADKGNDAPAAEEANDTPASEG